MKAAAVLAPVLLAAALLSAPMLPSPLDPRDAAAAAAAPAATAPGAPGALSHFDLARKDCVGTAAGRTSRVWYTVANGVLSDVYSPTVDNTNVETMQFVVTDGSTFTDIQTRDTTYTVRSLDPTGMACEVTSKARSGKYTIVTDYITDPARDAVVMKVRLQAKSPLSLFVRLDASVNGNGGGGSDNGGADNATIDAATGALVSSDPNTTTNAVNYEYAASTWMALRANRPFLAASSCLLGTASHRLVPTEVTPSPGPSYQTATDATTS